MPKNRIDVFISSTSYDLPEYRAAVVKLLNTLKLQPCGMEYWAVTGEDPVALCKRQVFGSEIYIGIYAHRYGWQPTSYGGPGIPEMGYEWGGGGMREWGAIPRPWLVLD